MHTSPTTSNTPFYTPILTALTRDTWAHIAVTWDETADDFLFYGDGVLLGTEPLPRTHVSLPVYMTYSCPWRELCIQLLSV